jgi:tetratricopeptide (TPR) repeat protein
VGSLLALVLAAAPHQALLIAALELEHQGSDTQALQQLEALTSVDPTWDLCRLEVARLRLKLGTDVERAGWHADVARALSPENPRAHYLWALTQDEAGHRDAATRALEVALTLRGDFADARFRLAGLLSSQARWSEAVGQWRAYLRTMPNATGARLQLAQALENSGEVKAAERELRALLSIDAVRVAAARRLIDLLEHTQRHGEAVTIRRSLDAPGRPLRPLKPSAR